ncbi:unnamed protein product [Callosobruchus maculatus]|nr:unnamed protein product [Callosobruchus maculatus]
MNDPQRNASGSKKRRNRRKNRKSSESSSQNVTEVNGNNCQPSTSISLEETDKTTSLKIVVEEYTVDSPKELSKDPKSVNKPIKSRSLDDDEMVKIQELSDVSGAEDRNRDNQAIVSEASESEAEQEKLSQPSVPTEIAASEEDCSLRNYLQGLNLSAGPEETPQETYERIATTPLLSIEEEQSLRNFLQGLNLVTGPEEAAQHVYDNTSNESMKQRKARKKAELEQYFLPMTQNPRFLEAISEEASDRDSDREQTDLKKHLKQGTPELDLPPKIPPRPNRDRRRARLNATGEPAVLVDARILDTGNVSQTICSTMKTEEAASNVEVVFLSSGTSTPDEEHSTSSNSYVLEDEKGSSIEDVSTSTLEIENNENENNENEIKENESKEPNNRTELNDLIKTDSKTLNGIKAENDELNKTTKSLSETKTSGECDKTVTANKDITANLLTELTPPPSPEDVCPKNDNTVCSSNEKTIQDDHFINVYNNAPKEDMYKRFIDKHQIKKTEEYCLGSYIKSTENLVKVHNEQSNMRCHEKSTVKKELKDEAIHNSGIKEKETVPRDEKIDRNCSVIKNKEFGNNILERNEVAEALNSTGIINGTTLDRKVSNVDELKNESEKTIQNKTNDNNKHSTSKTVYAKKTVCRINKVSSSNTDTPLPSTNQNLLDETNNVANNGGAGEKSDIVDVKQHTASSETLQKLSSSNKDNVATGNSVEEEKHTLLIEKPTAVSENVNKVLENQAGKALDAPTSTLTQSKSMFKHVIEELQSQPPHPTICKDTVLNSTYNVISDETATAKAEFIRKNVMSPPPRPPMYKFTPINGKTNEVTTQGTTSSPKQEAEGVPIDNKCRTVEIGFSRKDMSPPPRPPMYQEKLPYQCNDHQTNTNEIDRTGKMSLTPPTPPPRSSSSSCSSRGSSLCTAKYNPTTSSASDIASLVAEETHQHRCQPLTLRELCLKCLLELPFGADILQELADTSKSMELCSDFLFSKYSSKFAHKGDITVNDISSDISVGKAVGNMAAERTVPISKEWVESPADRVRRFGRSLDSFAGLSKPTKDWVKSLTEIDILRETEDLEKSKKIHVERNIPISKDWKNTTHNNLDSKTDTPVFRDLIQGMKKTEVLKEMDGEVVIDTSIPITMKSVTKPDAKPSSTEYVIPVTKAWEEKDYRMEETNNRFSESFPVTDIKSTKESCIHREQSTKQQNISSVKEFTVPIRKEWTETRNIEEHQKEVVIPITKDWDQSGKPKESTKLIHQNDIQKTSSKKTEAVKDSISQTEDWLPRNPSQ